MRPEEIAALTPIQQTTILTAVVIRTALEQFHAADQPGHFIDGEQMAKLNPVIRQAIFDAFTILQDDSDGQDFYERRLANMWAQVPAYWEVPTELSPGYRKKRSSPDLFSES